MKAQVKGMLLIVVDGETLEDVNYADEFAALVSDAVNDAQENMTRLTLYMMKLEK